MVKQLVIPQLTFKLSLFCYFLFSDVMNFFVHVQKICID